MARKRHKPEEIVSKLRQVDVLVSQGQNVVDAIRQIGVTEVTYYLSFPKIASRFPQFPGSSADRGSQNVHVHIGTARRTEGSKEAAQARPAVAQ
jgi:hypothetical protein